MYEVPRQTLARDAVAVNADPQPRMLRNTWRRLLALSLVPTGERGSADRRPG